MASSSQTSTPTLSTRSPVVGTRPDSRCQWLLDHDDWHDLRLPLLGLQKWRHVVRTVAICNMPLVCRYTAEEWATSKKQRGLGKDDLPLADDLTPRSKNMLAVVERKKGDTEAWERELLNESAPLHHKHQGRCVSEHLTPSEGDGLGPRAGNHMDLVRHVRLRGHRSSRTITIQRLAS